MVYFRRCTVWLGTLGELAGQKQPTPGDTPPSLSRTKQLEAEGPQIENGSPLQTIFICFAYYMHIVHMSVVYFSQTNAELFWCFCFRSPILAFLFYATKCVWWLHHHRRLAADKIQMANGTRSGYADMRIQPTANRNIRNYSIYKNIARRRKRRQLYLFAMKNNQHAVHRHTQQPRKRNTRIKVAQQKR